MLSTSGLAENHADAPPKYLSNVFAYLFEWLGFSKAKLLNKTELILSRFDIKFRLGNNGFIQKFTTVLVVFFVRSNQF